MSKEDKALAIAYSIKKKNAKKMAKGGMLPESAASERRPSPAANPPQVSEKPLMEADATSQPELRQARKGLKTMPIKHPKMVPSHGFSARLTDEEDHLQRLADGGEVDQYGYPKDKSKLKPLYTYAKGGEIAEAPHGSAGDPQSRPDTGFGAIIVKKAEGGMIDDQPEQEASLEDQASLVSAIMARRRRMANGGEVDLAMNAEESENVADDLNSEALMKENYSESEGLDDLSQPEDSNEHGDSIDSDEHDMIASIRRKMKMRSPITR